MKLGLQFRDNVCTRFYAADLSPTEPIVLSRTAVVHSPQAFVAQSYIIEVETMILYGCSHNSKHFKVLLIQRRILPDLQRCYWYSATHSPSS